MENKENNEFIGKKLLEPRAKVNPQIYEHSALYVALYQTIFGSYSDYGFNDRATVDVYITQKIKTMMKVIEKILQAPENANCTFEDFEKGNFHKPASLSGSLSADKHYLDEQLAFNHIKENNWIGNYLPLLKTKKTISITDPTTGAVTKKEVNAVDSSKYNSDKSGKKNYASEFLKNFDRAVAIAQDLTSKLGDRSGSGNMMTVNDARHMLKAEQNQLTELFEGYRAASEGQPFKYDKEGKKYKSGEYYEAYRGAGSNSALNRMKEKNYFIRKDWGKLALKTLGLAAFGGLTVLSAGALLSVGGIAMSSVFGTIFANMGIGTAVTGAIGTLVGGTISTRLISSIATSFGALYKRYKDRKEFFNGVGKYAPKDGKPQGFKKLREQYYTAFGLKEYFIHGDMRKLPRLSRKYVKKYLKENPGLEKQKFYYNFVDEQSGTFQTLYRKLANVVQAVPEQEKGRKMFAGEATSFVRNALSKTKFEDLIEASKVLEDYKEKIGDVNTNAFRAAMANSYVNAFMENIYNKAFTSDTLKLNKRLDVPEIKDTLEKYSTTGTSKSHIEASLAFMDAIKNPNRAYQSPFKLDTKLGASIEEQITLSKKVMVGACNRLCLDLTDVEKQQIESLASDIETASTTDQVTVVENNLNALSRTPSDASFEQAKAYLESMLKKRKATAKYSGVSIGKSIIPNFDETGASIDPIQVKVRNISNLISNLKRKDGQFVSGSKTITEIRSEIMSDVVGYTDVHKQQALDMLEKQVQSIECREYSDTEASLVSVMQQGNFNALTDYMKFIKELDYSKLDSVKSWYDSNIRNNTRRPFIDVQLKMKIENAILSEVGNTQYNDGTSASFDKIIAAIDKINSIEFLDDAQKSRIILSMSKGIEKAVRTKIDTAKQEFAMSYNSQDFTALTNKNNGKLRYYFMLETTETKKLKQELLGLAQLSDLKDMITAKIGGSQPLDEDVKEAYAFSLVYMYKGAGVSRAPGDFLYDSIKTINEKTKNALSSMGSNFNLSGRSAGAPPLKGQYILDMEDIVSNIMSSRVDDYEKYAALIILKKNCIAAYKSHISEYKSRVVIARGSNNFRDYFTSASNKDEFISQVYESWVYDNGTEKGLLNKIDESINLVKRSLSTAPKINDEEYYAYSALSSAALSINGNKADEYTSSASR